MSLSAHQSAAMKHDEWLTPPDILRPLGRFDLDPCAPIMRPWDTAGHHFNVNDDGLIQPWAGRVWLNPPFSGAPICLIAYGQDNTATLRASGLGHVVATKDLS